MLVFVVALRVCCCDWLVFGYLRVGGLMWVWFGLFTRACFMSLWAVVTFLLGVVGLVVDCCVLVNSVVVYNSLLCSLFDFVIVWLLRFALVGLLFVMTVV